MMVRVVDVDEENKSITYEIVEGDILSQYNLYKFKFQASNNGENGGATVKWSIEYEKADENVQSPVVYLQFSSKISMGVDSYLAKN